MAIQPAAKPSRPSVKFTAFDHALTTTMTNSRNNAGGRATVAISRTYDSCGLPGVRPSGLPNCSTRMPNSSAAEIWPTVLAVLFKPRLRDRRILIRSSRNPTPPSAVASPSTSNPDTEGPSPSITKPTRCAPKYPAQIPARMATPPMDGVPRLVWWLGGPSSRIS